MAIRKDVVWRGATIKNAYIRIESMQGGKRENRVTNNDPGEAVWQAKVGIYGAKGEPVPILVVDVTTPFDADTPPMAALYAAIKALPEFSGAVDDV